MSFLSLVCEVDAFYTFWPIKDRVIFLIKTKWWPLNRYTQTTSKIGFSAAPKHRNLPILSDLIFLILGHLKSTNSESFRALQNQFLKLFEYIWNFSFSHVLKTIFIPIFIKYVVNLVLRTWKNRKSIYYLWV